MALVACLVAILGIAAVSANDLNESDISMINGEIVEITEDNDDIEINDDKLCVEEDVEIVSANYTPSTASEIQTYVDSANEGNTIILDGTYELQSSIQVNKSLTFVGRNNTIIDGSSNIRLFSISYDGVLFKNIVFKNGYSSEGSAIYGGCTVINCTFINNTAYGSGYYNSAGVGGAISGECDVIECTFINNSARVGGALYEVRSVLNCTFINNSAKRFGGAMYRCNAINCTFKNNSAIVGGAVYETDVFNSSFIGNIGQVEYGSTWGHIDYTVVYSGGAMYGGNAYNCIFINNSAPYGGAICKGNADNCSFTKNNATYGGAIYKCRSLNSIFTNNHADSGGAVYAGSFIYCIFNNNMAFTEGNEIYIDSTEVYSSTFSLENCNFTNCVSNENWMISYNGISKLMINNVSFINCSSSTHGGAVNLKYGKVYFTNCYFERNSAIKGGAIYYNDYIMALENCYFKNNSAEYGGAIYSEFRNDIDRCSFETNNATYRGNDIFFNTTGNLNLIYCNFTKCISDEGGWFIDYNTNINSLTINSCNFINCSSKGNGGAIFIKDDLEYNIFNSYFEGNKATNGGAIYSKMNAFSCDNCTFVVNDADNGGAIFIDRVSSTEITNCTFVDNDADNGGAFYSNYGSFLVENCNFTGNSARFGGAANINNGQYSNFTNCVFERNWGNGAGIYFENSISLIDNCKFMGQYAFISYRTPDGYYRVEGDGGALYVVDSEIKVYNSEFNSNEAFLDTGGILGYVEAFNCSFFHNIGGHAPFGGAMKEGIAINCTFEHNFGHYGGAMYGGSAINCTFIHNSLTDTSASSGGALYDTNAFNCTFIGNNAYVNGGAMYGGIASNCTFIGNTARESGGAVFASSVENCTFINNSARNGGAVYTNSNINSCTFINCSASNNGGAIAFNTSDPISLINSQFFDCHADNQSGAVDFGQCKNLTISKCSFENCTSGNDSGYLGINDAADVYVEDCIFDELPDDVPIHYTSYLTVNNLKITLGENAILLANLSNVQCPLFNKTIIFSIGGKMYNSTTDNNGLAIFNLKEYLTSPGKYTIGVSFLGDGLNSNATVDSNVTINSYQGILVVNAEGKYYDDVVLKFKLFNSKTNEDINNATVKVKFGSGEIVYLKTNSKGIATYHVPFVPGTYNATVEVIDENVDVNNVTLSNIVINKIEGLMKVTQVDNILNVRVYNPADGHQYRNITVTLKFNHIDPVNVVTNDDGVAIYNMEFDYGTYSVFAYVSKPYTNIDAVSVDDIVIKEDNSYATVSFSSGIVFEYGTSGSICVTVKGGSIEIENIKVLNHPEARITLVKNVITVSNLNPGIYTLMVVSTPFGDFKAGNGTVKINVKKATAVIKAQKITVALKKGSLWSIKLVNSKTGKAIGNMKLNLKVYTGKKYKTVSVKTNSKGIANYQTKGLSKGNHKVVVSAKDIRYNFNTLTSSIKVIKQTTLKFKVKKKSGKDGVSLSITVMNKKTKKPINGVKVKLLIYTGKKYKTVTLKSMKKGKFKGVCGYGTNKLSVGKHKVKIMPAEIKYSGSAKSTMKITKKHKKAPAWETKDSAK